MPGFTLTERIGAPIETVFDRFSDFARAAENISQITRIEMLSTGPVGVGTRFRESRRLHGHEATEEMLISEFEPNRRYVLTCDNCGAEYRTEFRFQPTDDHRATLVEVEFGARAVSLFAKLMAPLAFLMRGMIQKCVAQDLADLKVSLERGSGPE